MNEADKQPFLSRGQPVIFFFLHGPDGMVCLFGGPVDVLGQFFDGGCFKHNAQGQLNIKRPVNLRRHAGGVQRVPAQFEEIVIDAHAGFSQQFSPYPGQPFFGNGLGKVKGFGGCLREQQEDPDHEREIGEIPGVDQAPQHLLEAVRRGEVSQDLRYRGVGADRAPGRAQVGDHGEQP